MARCWTFTKACRETKKSLCAEAAAEPSPEGGEDAADRPLGRMGEPAEIAAAAVFLASDEAGFITGQNLAVNGGMSFL